MQLRTLGALASSLLLLAGFAAPHPPLPADLISRLGDGFALAEGPAGRVGLSGRRVADAIRRTLGLDAGAVRIHVVDKKTLRDLHRAIGGTLRYRIELEGLALGGRVFIKDELIGVNEAVLTHEVLHVLSARFADEASGRGFHSLVEGLTEYFSQRVMPARPARYGGLIRKTTSPAYVHNTRLAAELADRIGQERLERCFFGSGFTALEREVDARLGRGALRRAAMLLEMGDYARARAALGATDPEP